MPRFFVYIKTADGERICMPEAEFLKFAVEEALQPKGHRLPITNIIEIRACKLEYIPVYVGGK